LDLSNHELLRTQVYEYLRTELREGNLKPGKFLSMNQLQGQVGISRTPLRDALLLLQAEGFVDFLPQRGIRINELTQQDIENMYEILGALDSRALISVFDRIGDREIEEMKKINEEMAKNLGDHEFPRYWDLNTAFHGVYLNFSSNAPLLNQLSIVRQRLFAFGKEDWSLKMKRMNYSEHLKMIELIERGDAIGAANFMRDVHCAINF
jgi:DNA-binding GntR family transcriptional regulator